MQTQRQVNVGGSKPASNGGGGNFPAEACMLHWSIVKPAEDKINAQKGNRVDLTVFFQPSWEDAEGVTQTGEFRKFYYIVDGENEADFRAFKAKAEPDKDPDKAIKFFKDQLVRLYVSGGALEEGVQADEAEITIDDETLMGLEGECYFWPRGTEGIGNGGKGPSKYASFYLLTPSEVELVQSGEWTPEPEVERAEQAPVQTAPAARGVPGRQAPAQAPVARQPQAPAARQPAAPPPRPAARPAPAKVQEEEEVEPDTTSVAPPVTAPPRRAAPPPPVPARPGVRPPPGKPSK